MTVSHLLGLIAQYILNPIIVFGFVVALLYFFYGIFQFVWKAGEDKDREEGKRSIVWGIIGMFIMIGVFGIIHIILNTFGIEQDPSISNNSYVKTLLQK